MYVLSYVCMLSYLCAHVMYVCYMYVCAQLFISYVCAVFISYVCMCSVIYKLCMYVLSYL